MSALLEAASLSKTFFSEHNALPAVCNVGFSVAPANVWGWLGQRLRQKHPGTSAYGTDAGRQRYGQLQWPAAGLCRCRTAKKLLQSGPAGFSKCRCGFSPPQSIGSSIMLPMLNYGCTKAAAQERSIALLLAAGLTPQHAEKFPHQLSGGECQRAAIARAISIKPRLLICDEITSALDVQTQAEIIQLLLKLQAETKMSLLFISHDITLVQEICQRILIMQSGTIIESGPALDIITRPQQHYTRELVTAAFNLTKI